MLWNFPILIICLGIFFYWQNNGIMLNEINYRNPKIPDSFDDYKIIHISDLHNKSFGKNQKRLMDKIRKNKPDIIVITGDLIDQRRYDLNTAMEFVKKAVGITDVYYVSGNHELWSGKYEEIKKTLQGEGVTVLDDQKSQIVIEEDSIEIIGLSDPAFHNSYEEIEKYGELKNRLKKLIDESVFQILLSHRPELFELYADAKVDLTFSGHTHGGQFRIPLVGGIIAAGQGLFPIYINALYTKGDSTMVVSRGLGNSIIPIRIGNRPELVVVRLKKNYKK